MIPLSYRLDAYEINTDKTQLDLSAVHAALLRTYWAEGMPRATLEKAIAHSLCYGIYLGREQVGFGRVITDHASYAYLTDVYILEVHRKKGLSKWLVECILKHPDLQSLRRFALLTWDAQALYQKFGFQPLEHPERYLEIFNPNVYKGTPLPTE